MNEEKSLLPTPENLTLDDIQSRFSTDQAARQYLEEIRWPDGVVCPHCGNKDQAKFWAIKASATAKIRAGLRQCGVCKKQFTCTVGTIFEDSHIPLRKWLVAWYLLCSSKKGISSLQIQRMVGLGSYRSALFMMHRIRYALKHPSFTKMLSGTVEMDETYVGGKEKPGYDGTLRSLKTGHTNKTAVVSMIERETGEKRSFVMPRVTVRNVAQAIAETAVMNTDQSPVYPRAVAGRTHRTVLHNRKEYVRKENGEMISTNYAESSFSLLKRGVYGTFHSVSRKHLHLYISEFDHRWNHRLTSDGARTIAGIKMAEGKRLTLKPLKNKGK